MCVCVCVYVCVCVVCPRRSFGFDKYWERKKAAHASSGRRLALSTALQEMSEWILGDPTATNADECTEYVARATANDGEAGLLAHDSEHASFQILTPAGAIRLSHGRLHQLPMRDATDSFDVPEHRTWQMNLAVDHTRLSWDATGILGETLLPTLDDGGKPIMLGLGSIRGSPEDCKWHADGLAHITGACKAAQLDVWSPQQRYYSRILWLLTRNNLIYRSVMRTYKNT